MHETWILVWDPTGEQPEGRVLRGAEVPLAKSRGCAVLPVDEPLFRVHGASGFVKRQWGDGLDYSGNLMTKRDGKLAMWIAPERNIVHWQARLQRVVHQYSPKQEPIRGQLSLQSDSSQLGCATVGLGVQEQVGRLETIGESDSFGGWTIGGRAQITSSPATTFVGFCLYGQAENVRLQWFAMTLTR